MAQILPGGGQPPCFSCRRTLGAKFAAVGSTALRLMASCTARLAGKGPTANCFEEVVGSEVPCFDPGGRVRRLLDRVAAPIARRCPPGEPVLQNYPSENPLILIDPLVAGQTEPCFLVGLRAWRREVLGGQDLGGQALALRCRDQAARLGARVVKKTLRTALRCQRTLDRDAVAFGALDPACFVPPPAGLAARVTDRLARHCTQQGVSDFGGCTPLPDCVLARSVETAHRLAADTFLPVPTGDTETLCSCIDGSSRARCGDDAACEPLCASHGSVNAASCMGQTALCQ